MSYDTAQTLANQGVAEWCQNLKVLGILLHAAHAQMGKKIEGRRFISTIFPYMGLLLPVVCSWCNPERAGQGPAVPSCFVDSPCAVLYRLGLFVLRWDFPTRNRSTPPCSPRTPKEESTTLPRFAVGIKGQKNKKVSTFLVL